ncbi:MAG: carboxymuconolactone decarboxylase family protein, partial [Nitrososphaerales archaeon]
MTESDNHTERQEDTTLTDTNVISGPRMKNPAAVIPEAMQAIQALIASCEKGDLPSATREMVHLRVSQINGCSF